MGQLVNKFGKTGLKGEAGEEFMYKMLQLDYTVSDYRKDLIIQGQGIDFGIRRPEWNREYTLDVKNNLYLDSSYYAFKIEIQSGTEAGWFFTSKADRIYHTNAYSGRYLYYNLNELRYFVTKRLLSNDYSDFNVVQYNSDVLLHFKIEFGQNHMIPISKLS